MKKRYIDPDMIVEIFKYGDILARGESGGWGDNPGGDFGQSIEDEEE